MTNAPNEVYEWIENLREMIDGLMQDEKRLKKLIKQEIEEGEEVEEEQKKKLNVEKKWEKDLEEIHSNFQQIVESTQDLENHFEASEGGKYDFRQIMDNVQEDFQIIKGDFSTIEEDISEIESGLSQIKEANEYEIELAGDQKQKFKSTFSVISQGENDIKKVRRMVGDFTEAAFQSDDASLQREAEELQNKESKLEEKLEKLRESGNQVEAEISEEETLIREELDLDEEMLTEIDEELKEDGELSSELEKIEGWIENHGHDELEENLNQFRQEAGEIRTHLENIASHIDELEEQLSEAVNELEK